MLYCIVIYAFLRLPHCDWASELCPKWKIEDIGGETLVLRLGHWNYQSKFSAGGSQ